MISNSKKIMLSNCRSKHNTKIRTFQIVPLDDNCLYNLGPKWHFCSKVVSNYFIIKIISIQLQHIFFNNYQHIIEYTFLNSNNFKRIPHHWISSLKISSWNINEIWRKCMYYIQHTNLHGTIHPSSARNGFK